MKLQFIKAEDCKFVIIYQLGTFCSIVGYSSIVLEFTTQVLEYKLFCRLLKFYT